MREGPRNLDFNIYPPGDVFVFGSLRIAILWHKITGPPPLSLYFCHVCGLKKKAYISFAIKKSNKNFKI